MFGISRQAIYKREHSYIKREQELKEVCELVETKRHRMPRLGTRKLYHLLKSQFVDQGIKLGRDGLFRVLKRENMLIKPRKNYTKTTNSKHWLRKHPNLYSNMILQSAEKCFVSDITYLKSDEGTHYLSLVTDAYSRKIMGYHLSNDMSSENVVKALKMANQLRSTNNVIVHHSDRGLQYCSQTYQDELKRNNMTPSMTDGYDCYQNALAERINGILKHEFILYKPKSFNELEKLVKESVNIYNEERPHLMLNYKTPNIVHQKTTEENLQWSKL